MWPLENETVAIFPVRLFWIMHHDVEVERGKNVGHPQWACRVAASGLDEHLNEIL